MNHLFKRSLSLIMAVLMVLAMIPANPVHVHAEDDAAIVGFEAQSDKIKLYNDTTLGTTSAKGSYSLDKTNRLVKISDTGYVNFKIVCS